jgi:pimeloyl-ACP methyl ester carboxylesterase
VGLFGLGHIVRAKTGPCKGGGGGRHCEWNENHYLRAGTGETTIVLLHGWPESSHEWHKVIPALSEKYTVIAPDLRGIGSSRATATGYDKVTLAEDIHELVTQLGLKHVYVVGHDIGGMVAYAYARVHPADLSGAAIIDIPIPVSSPGALSRAPPGRGISASTRFLASRKVSWLAGRRSTSGIFTTISR